MVQTERKSRLHPLLQQRWSPRAFVPGKPLSTEQAEVLFEAARWAPSSWNEQPWRYWYALWGEPGFNDLLEVLVEANRQWARNASMLILSAASMKYRRNGKPNKHAWYDTGQANFALTVQATAMGLYVHQMGGFSAEKAKALLALPDDIEPVVMMAVGYKGDPAILDADLRPLEIPHKERLPLEKLVCHWSSAP